jgi:hypothetical protein
MDQLPSRNSCNLATHGHRSGSTNTDKAPRCRSKRIVIGALLCCGSLCAKAVGQSNSASLEINQDVVTYYSPEQVFLNLFKSGGGAILWLLKLED